jgi:hypothetical protein
MPWPAKRTLVSKGDRPEVNIKPEQKIAELSVRDPDAARRARHADLKRWKELKHEKCEHPKIEKLEKWEHPKWEKFEKFEKFEKIEKPEKLEKIEKFENIKREKIEKIEIDVFQKEPPETGPDPSGGFGPDPSSAVAAVSKLEEHVARLDRDRRAQGLRRRQICAIRHGGHRGHGGIRCFGALRGDARLAAGSSSAISGPLLRSHVMNQGFKGQKPAGSRPDGDKPGRYRLTIPLDASGIADREGAAELKVAARDSKGGIRAQSVKIDAKGQCAATWSSMKSLPHCGFVGPADASDDELVNLETLKFTIARRWTDQPHPR